MLLSLYFELWAELAKITKMSIKFRIEVQVVYFSESELIVYAVLRECLNRICHTSELISCQICAPSGKNHELGYPVSQVYMCSLKIRGGEKCLLSKLWYFLSMLGFTL